MLVTHARYRTITGDDHTPEQDFADALADAVEQLEDELDRPLAEDQRTETLRPMRDGRLWPRATPIVAGPDGYVVDGEAFRGALPWAFDPLDLAGTSTGVEVVYTGGFVERTANPAAANRLPTYIERDLAWAAHRLAHPVAATSAAPVGATSVRVGDVAVGYGPGGAPAPGDAARLTWSRRTLAWRYAPIGSTT